MLIQCEKCGTDYPSYFPEQCPGCELLQVIGNSSTIDEERLQSLWDVKDKFKYIDLLICTSCQRLYYTARGRSQWNSEHLCTEPSCRHSLVAAPSIDWENFKRITSFGGQVFFSYPEKYMEEQLEKYNLFEEEELRNSLVTTEQFLADKELFPQEPRPPVISTKDLRRLDRKSTRLNSSH